MNIVGNLSDKPLPPIEPGRKMQSEEAKKYVDGIYERTYKKWDERVNNSWFMRELSTGKLPKEAIQLFWLNYYGFVSEINNIIASVYQKHQGFFKRHSTLNAAFASKIAEELIYPKPPGHILIVLEQGKTFGLTEDQMVNYPMLTECRALLDWHRGLLYEGTIVEFWAALADEEPVGLWAKKFREALMKNYNFKVDQTKYFKTHEEADLETHSHIEDNAMPHGEFNRVVLQKLLENGEAYFRPGYSAEYCALTSVDAFGLYLDGIEKHFRMCP